MPQSLALRPFFKYYGGKWRSAALYYPAPQHPTIVEPFAGAAGYSMRYPSRKVILCEIDPIIYGVWSYLVAVSKQEIMRLPDLLDGQTTSDINVPQEAKWLIGLWLNAGVSSPRKSPSKWMREGRDPGVYWGSRARQTISSQVDSIRHWIVRHCGYQDAPTPAAATWFIDPPYKEQGSHYRFGAGGINYSELGRWCRSRNGQVIVCESASASWLPFRHLSSVKTTRVGKKFDEGIWLRNSNPLRRPQANKARRKAGCTARN